MSMGSALSPRQFGSTWSRSPEMAPIPSSPWTAAFIASSLFFSQGTGANLSQRIGHQQPIGSGFAVAFREARKESIADLSDILLEIRLALGLKITELAHILRVERQTIYAWLKPGTQAKPHSRNADRLASIGEIASQWRAGGNVHSARNWIVSPSTPGGPSLLERMADDDIEVALILADLNHVSKSRMSAAPEVDARKKRLQELRRRGLKPPPGPGQYDLQSPQVRIESDEA